MRWPGFRRVRRQVCRRIERRRQELGLADLAAYRVHLRAVDPLGLVVDPTDLLTELSVDDGALAQRPAPPGIEALAADTHGPAQQGDRELCVWGAKISDRPCESARFAGGTEFWHPTGRRRRPKTDKLDARWLTVVLARELLSECEAWMPPALLTGQGGLALWLFPVTPYERHPRVPGSHLRTRRGRLAVTRCRR